jgi:branched-chain amino acid transport system substrate-binding protein
MDTFQGTVMAKFARTSLKLQNVAILSSVSSPQSVALGKIFRERFTELGGKIAAEQKFTDGDKDFRAQLTAIKAAKAEGIYVPCYYTEAALICKQARDLGIEAPLFGIDGWESSEFLSIGGKAVEGGYFSTHYSPESQDPVVVSFNAHFKQRWGIPSDAISACGYDAAILLIDALKRAGSTEPAKLRAAIAATNGFRGVTGIISFDEQRNVTKSAVVLTVKNGKFVFVETVNP